jgi:hypothetical protein
MEVNGLNQSKKVEELQTDCKYWISTFNFFEEEIIFIKKLLDSFAFEPNTPNLFERLQDFKKRLAAVNIEWKSSKESILQHENNLVGMLKCKDKTCDLTFYNAHNILKKQVLENFDNFKILKSEIFNYAGGILKNNKP